MFLACANNDFVKATCYESCCRPLCWLNSSPILILLNCCTSPLYSIHDEAEEEIVGLPGQKRWGVNRLAAHLEPLMRKGLKCVLLFGVVDAADKDEIGTIADSDAGPTVRAVQMLRAQLPDLTIACDVCLCTFTPQHHCCAFSLSSIYLIIIIIMISPLNTHKDNFIFV